LAGEIAQSVPDFTVHDITHLDALWEVADDIVGEHVALTPTEAFTLGGSFLVHDLGMGVAAWAPGERPIEDEEQWTVQLRRNLRRYLGRAATSSELEHPPQEVRRRTLQAVLRMLHAYHAERLPLVEWTDPRTRHRFHLIEDPDIRLAFGELIGRIAKSHWSDANELPGLFPEQSIGAPVPFPRQWFVHPLRLACLLRLADAAHLDSRRAPAFLRAVRIPSSSSVDHWAFQARMRQLQRVADRLVFTAAPAFGPEDASAWWTCFDILRDVDREFRSVDALLADRGETQFCVRSVAGVEDSRRLTRYVPTRDWIPVDAKLRVDDVAGLVRKLGGAELYGERPHVALRELLQNGIDAVRARRVVRDQPAYQGEVQVSLTEEPSGHVLVVRDNGIGMSEEALASSLLDFGSSYWASDLADRESPKLGSEGFDPAGKYGIGFYASFMLGREVSVVTRRYDAALRETYVLDFMGLEGRPVVRVAQPNECLQECGTLVKVRLERSPMRDKGLLSSGVWDPWKLPELCQWLVPTSRVDIVVKEEWPSDQQSRTTVVSAKDWLELSSGELVNRLQLRELKGGWQKEHRIAFVERYAKNLRAILEGEEVVARLAIVPGLGPNRWYRLDGLAAITTKGVRTDGRLLNCIGVSEGLSRKASRDEAVPTVSLGELAAWASQQRVLIQEMPYKVERFECAAPVLACGGEVSGLPVALTGAGLLEDTEVEAWAGDRDRIVIADILDFQVLRRGKTGFCLLDIEYSEEVDLDPEVLSTADPPGNLVWPTVSSDERWPVPKRSDPDVLPDFPVYWEWRRKTLLGVVLTSIAAAWNSSSEELLRRAGYRFGELYGDREPWSAVRQVGHADDRPIRTRALELRRPPSR
jgi:hypothetical protein